VAAFPINAATPLKPVTMNQVATKSCLLTGTEIVATHPINEIQITALGWQTQSKTILPSDI
jgi:hypothetical protein